METDKVYWAGPIGFEGLETGDGRFIQHDALEWDASEEDPIPLRYVNQDVGAHANAESVGAITSIERRPGGIIWGEGWLDATTEEGRKAIHKVENKTQRGISMDLDDVVWEEKATVEEGDELTSVTTSARIRAATLVQIPAFAEALINTVDNSEELSLTGEDTLQVNENASGAVIVLLPAEGEEVIEASSEVAHLTLAWLGDWADLEAMPELAESIQEEVTEWAETLEPVTLEVNSRGVLGEDSADVLFFDRSEELLGLRESLVNLEAVQARMGMVEQFEDWVPHLTLGYPETPPNVDFPEDQIPESVQFDRVAIWFGEDRIVMPMGGVAVDSDIAEDLIDMLENEGIEAVTAASAPVNPPLEWFQNPELYEPTPITITEEGRIYGHLAAWDTCHTANPAGHGVCVSPPSSPSNYSRFHLGTLQTKEGQIISVGKITMSTGHAGPKASPSATLAHYDNTGTAVADVRAGEDAHGIWVSGAIRPNVSEEKKRVLRASPLSGDWRRVDGNLELHAALAVNVPGFPIPARKGLVASGELTALVASGIVMKESLADSAEESLTHSELPFSDDDIEFLKNMVASARMVDKQQKAQKINSFANKRKVEKFVRNRNK